MRTRIRITFLSKTKAITDMIETMRETVMTTNSKERMKSNENLWNKTCKILLQGISFSVIGALSQILVKHFKHELLSTSEVALYAIVFFSVGAYVMVIRSEEYDERILKGVSPSWRKVTATFSLWLYFSVAWVVGLIISAVVVQQVSQIDPSIVSMIFVYVLYALLFLLSVYSIAIYIPSSQYLASADIEEKDKKKVADTLTVLTPILGFPWIIATYLVLFFANIPIDPDWLNFVVFVSIYAIVYLLFVDLPYSSSILEKKKQELESLEKERDVLLTKLQKLDSDTSEALLRKITFESEIARMDRKKQEIKSRKVHPYKFIIPFASFFLGIFGAIFIEIIKNLLQLA